MWVRVLAIPCEIVFDGLDGEGDQIGAGEEGLDPDAVGEKAVVGLVDLVVNAGEDGVGVFAFLTKDDTFDGVGIVEDGAVGEACGAADLAQANLGTLGDNGDVANVDGRAVGGFDDGDQQFAYAQHRIVDRG